MSQFDKTQALKHSTLGAELDDAECAVLAERMGEVALSDGETLVKEGEARQTLFLLGSGKMDVIRDQGGAEARLHRMRAGECAGTRAFVDGSTRKAALRAVGEARVLTLEPADFESMLEEHAGIVYKVMRAIFRITHANLMRMNQESAELKNYVVRAPGRY
ncbi:Crp/Fnr family transcriptional regulator [Marichromatium bheemlicum]|uniref:Cyclic nucleotide-binding domain-containing protein n=1 Tax=Marichromatium bheemlicum TaxID=365339 RepID=A0ABX1I3V9_9GAMM|nr:cyclic nucleotide-binding domain-containing protein [Marichromatium bheemlicum]NKN32227.1 cyclic nucleotide-binding domain-containing protein [Marichromatium bheemlicum]